MSGTGVHAGIPMRRVGSSDGTGVTTARSDGTAWISQPSSTGAARMSRSAPSAPAIGTPSAAVPVAVTAPATMASATQAATCPEATASRRGAVRSGEGTSANKGAARAAVSASGSGSATRPASSRTRTRSRSPRPRPPSPSGRHIPTTPISAKVAHRPERADGDAKAARRSPGVHSLDSTWWTASPNWRCSEVKAKCMSLSTSLSRAADRACARPPRCAGSHWCRRR